MTDKVILPSESDDGFAHFTIDRNSKFIRFYLWLYGAKANNINTCKLFWAYVFAPLALIVHGVVAAVSPLFRAVEKRIPEPDYDARYQRAREKKAAKAAAGPSKGERFLDKVSAFFSAAYVKIAPVLKVVAIGVGVLLGLAVAGTIIYLLITNPIKVAVVVLVTLAILALVLLGMLGIEKLDDRAKANGEVPFFSTMGKLFRGFHRHTCAKVNFD